jgi:hypothetical protein
MLRCRPSKHFTDLGVVVVNVGVQKPRRTDKSGTTKSKIGGTREIGTTHAEDRHKC